MRCHPCLPPCGPTIEPLPIWTHCGLRIDAEAVWNGTDDAAWEHERMPV